MNNMKERPILMSTEMVQSILKGWKTQTRRTRGLELINGSPCNYHPAGDFIDSMGRSCKIMRHTLNDRYHPPRSVVCEYGKPGDILWVRETWSEYYDPHGDPFYPLIAYRADNNATPARWRPSIHMLKSAARIWLMITGVRVERLWDITEESAISEGVEPFGYVPEQTLYRDYRCKPPYGRGFKKALKSFQSLWEQINGEDSWIKNPWVWVISFEVLSTTGRPETFHELTSAS